jgi:hypothetical protein
VKQIRKQREINNEETRPALPTVLQLQNRRSAAITVTRKDPKRNGYPSEANLKPIIHFSGPDGQIS